MKRILLLGVLLCVISAVRAQKIYFIYFQMENNAPFFVKMGEKVYSSTAEGYLILPRLVDSTYTFAIGKPGRQAAETRFSVRINRNDRGFLVREAEHTFSLFDLQSMEVIKAVAGAGPQRTDVAKRSDNFTLLLAQAADDSTLLYVPAVAKTEAVAKSERPEPVPPPAQVTTAKTESLPAAPKGDTTVVLVAEGEPKVGKANPDTVVAVIPQAKGTPDTAVARPATVAQAVPEKESAQPDTTSQQSLVQSDPPRPDTLNRETVQQPVTGQAETAPPAYQRSRVTRRSESSTTEGFGLVFLDNQGTGVVDTIRILIPNPKIVFAEAPREGRLQSPGPAAGADSVLAIVPAQRAVCKEVATENDFLKLRRSMVARDTEEEMISEARKYFKSKCFSTDQIKSLSALFLTPQGKYGFFDVAYLHVSDQEQFPSLQQELKDSYYANRFKALIGN